MGNFRLGELSRTRKWDQVVELIKSDGDAAQIAGAALNAADAGYREAANDEGVARVTWLLTQLPLAARDPHYVERLAELGIDVSGAPGLIELAGAFTDAVDGHMRRSAAPTAGTHGGGTHGGRPAQRRRFRDVACHDQSVGARVAHRA